MNDTVIAMPHRLRDRVAVAHDDSVDPVPTWTLGVLAGAGGFRSTVADLLLFLDALCDQDSPIASMVSPHCGVPAEEWNWGGRIPMQGSPFRIGAPPEALVLSCAVFPIGSGVVLSNAGIDAVVDFAVRVLDQRFASHWYRRETTVDPVALARLVGRYRAIPNTMFEVTTRDNRLFVRRSGQSDLRAFPMSEWQFFHKAVNAQLTFEPGGDRHAVRLILHQNGSDQIAEGV
jgi:serine-type D-Ala-D-Ala carboxypeptidase/endopeptidase